MDQSEEVVSEWAETVYGVEPLKISIWGTTYGVIQAMIKLDDRVVVCSLVHHEEGRHTEEEARLEVELANWQQGSIQGRQMKNGSIRIKHRTREIYLEPQIRAPEWVAALLEEWLMSMRGEAAMPKSKSSQINNVKRKKESISRLLEQADFDLIKDEVRFIRMKLNNAETRLSGESE